MRRGGQERRWLDGNIKAQVRTSILQLVEKAVEVESVPMRKSRRVVWWHWGWETVRAAARATLPANHASLLDLRRGGVNTHAHTQHRDSHSFTSPHSSSAAQPRQLRSRVYPYSRSDSIGWWKTDSLLLPKTLGYFPLKAHDWDAANASMHRVTGSPLSLARSLHTPFFSFTLRICLTFHFLPPSPPLSLSPRTHTCTLFLSLGVEQTEMHAKLKRGGGKRRSVTPLVHLSLFINPRWKKLEKGGKQRNIH